MEPTPEDYKELQRWFTEAEIVIVKNALAKEATGEELTTVEAVMLREWKLRMEAREQRRQAEKKAQDRNRSNGGPV